MAPSLGFLALLLSLYFYTVNACAHGTHLIPRDAQVPIAKFGYSGPMGSLGWAKLDSSNAACATGKIQSPIDFSSSFFFTSGSLYDFKVQNYPSGAEIENIGSTIQIVANGTLSIGGKTYSLTQFHFHTPGEHRVDGEHFPIEAHFVHQAADKSIAVVAFFVEIGTLDPLLGAVFANVEHVSTPGMKSVTGPLDFGALQKQLTENKTFRYTGSLTAPPCAENILWNISNKPLYIDAQTYKRVKQIMKFNSRYTQNILGNENLLDELCHS